MSFDSYMVVGHVQFRADDRKEKTIPAFHIRSDVTYGPKTALEAITAAARVLDAVITEGAGVKSLILTTGSLDDPEDTASKVIPVDESGVILP